jgi:hypothetical protein
VDLKNVCDGRIEEVEDSDAIPAKGSISSVGRGCVAVTSCRVWAAESASVTVWSDVCVSVRAPVNHVSAYESLNEIFRKLNLMGG